MKRFWQATGAVGTFVLLPLFAACGDDELIEPSTHNDGSVDASIGNDATSSSADASPPDSSTAPPAAAFWAVSDLITVNSAVRLCFLASPAAEPTLAGALDMIPQPAAADGIAPGKSGRVELPVTLTGRSLRPVIFYVDSLVAFGLNDKRCTDLFANVSLNASIDAGLGPSPGGNLLEGADFEFGHTVTAGTLTTDHPHMLLLSGCPRATTEAARENAACGADFVAGDSDVRTYFYSLDATPTVPEFNRVQYVFGAFTTHNLFTAQQLAPYPSLTYRPNGVVVSAYLPSGSAALDTGTPTPYVERSGALTYPEGTQVTSLSTLDSTYLEWQPGVGRKQGLASIFEASPINATEAGQAYVIVGVGSIAEPALVDDRRNFRAYHTLLLPVE